MIILMVSIVASVFVVLAPGNTVRGQLFPDGHNWIQTIKMVTLGFSYYTLQWLPMSLVVASLALWILKEMRIELGLHRLFIPLIASITIFALVLLASLIVPAWATGQMPNLRAINIVFFISDSYFGVYHQ